MVDLVTIGTEYAPKIVVVSHTRAPPSSFVEFFSKLEDRPDFFRNDFFNPIDEQKTIQLRSIIVNEGAF